MLYNIDINQKAVHDAGLIGKLSIESIIIFDLMTKAFADLSRLTLDGKEYAWFSYNLISSELPILQFKKDTIYRKVKELIDNGFIEAHPDNRKMGKTFFRLSKEAKTLMTGIGLKSDGSELGTDKNPNDIRIKIRETHSDKNPYNNSTTKRNYNNTSDNKESDDVVNDTHFSNIPLKENKKNEKVNSGGGAAQNSQPNVSNSNKPKKPVREWFKLSSLTEEQKDKIRKLSREFDSPAVFGDSLRQWLEYKEAGEINFRNQKINPYKDFETMLKQVTIEAKKCQGQSQAFKLAVEYSIENLYLGLFPDKFTTQTTPKNGTNNNKNQPNSKRQYATGI